MSAASGPLVRAAVKKDGVLEYPPFGAKYDTIYVVPAVRAYGVERVAVCHPLAVSPLKVTLASRAPEVDQSDPVWVPVLPVPL